MQTQLDLKPTLQQFVALESRVWEAFVAGDAAADASLLSEEFIGVYSTGFSGKAAHCDQLKAGPVAQRYEIQQPQLMALSDTLVMLSYLAVWVRTGAAADAPPEKMYVSSLWQRANNGQWMNVFSQDTPAG